MKKALLICVVWVASVALALADDTRTFNLSNFSKLEIGSAYRIQVKQGSTYSVTASGQKQDLDDLEARVSNGTLSIRYKQEKWKNRRETVQINITMPELDAVDFSGACVANVTGFSSNKNMNIEVSGASKVTMDVSAPKVHLNLSGASVLTLNGKADVLNGELSGASVYKGTSFPVREANLGASGASKASVVANTSLTADASGASSISYSGSAREVRSNTSGASSIRRSN
ncbi:head GIN domain-containing protein [Telluribacter sp. SYSU D00476]|uniref:head GIN domain-containing protein n=1 Tax=Telluribacter sp. SYSU D00476 TaxID=2811430 RepID=UPI001FF59426|nr:head GIN domain-containing protein [Telluribacter sp. SYSU D00476]